MCAIGGNDGPPAGSLSGVINTYYPGTLNANAGATSISIGTSTGSATPIAIGDLLPRNTNAGRSDQFNQWGYLW